MNTGKARASVIKHGMQMETTMSGGNPYHGHHIKEFCAYAERYEGDELYETLLEKAMDGESADVQMINREINQRQMDEMMESELYEYADDTTKRMINKQILETASNENEFLERDYMELIPFYIE